MSNLAKLAVSLNALALVYLVAAYSIPAAQAALAQGEDRAFCESVDYITDHCITTFIGEL